MRLQIDKKIIKSIENNVVNVDRGHVSPPDDENDTVRTSHCQKYYTSQ